MKIRTENYTSFKEYLEDIKEKDYLSIDSGFIQDLDNSHVCDIFRDILNDNKIFVTFDNEEKRKYNYRPKILSNQLYTTPDLFFIILKLNNLTHPAEFEIDEGVYIMNQRNLPKLIGSIQELKNTL